MIFFKRIALLFGFLILAAALLVRVEAAPAAPAFNPVNTDLGYGFNVAAWDIGLLENLGFDWVKVFNAPGSRLPVSVLLRIDVQANVGEGALRGTVRGIAQNNGAYIEAYEIGNEVNLDASYGWGTSPDAAA